ncbi:L-ascorbate oxidase-like protein [Hibiscus syriacus]|uniref:L-ascorbate oxidase-like protein n=1 Tax=Hibiscus syriacus TaxID=106335 RepID=A0A6A3B3A7_HIBSY|nr:L-ascorbate oxidase-like protein [Hibiscus syriacus]
MIALRPDGVLINGKAGKVGAKQEAFFTMKPDKTYMYRICNVGHNASINFRIQGHTMKLMEMEGSQIVHNLYDSLDVHNRQFFKVLVTADQAPKDYYIVASTRFHKEVQTSTAIISYTNGKGEASPELPPAPIGWAWSLNQFRTFRWNLTASTSRPNPQGSYHYGAINITCSIKLVNACEYLNMADKVFKYDVMKDEPENTTDLIEQPNVLNMTFRNSWRSLLRTTRKACGHTTWTERMCQQGKPSVIAPAKNILVVLLSVRSHRLEKFLIGTDSALASWLLSTMSPSILPHMVGTDTAAQVWSTVTKFFASSSTTMIMNLHYRLKAIKKEDLSMRNFITKVKELCDALAACGSPVSEYEQIATILNGLSSEYRPFVAIITASWEPFTLDGGQSWLKHLGRIWVALVHIKEVVVVLSPGFNANCVERYGCVHQGSWDGTVSAMMAKCGQHFSTGGSGNSRPSGKWVVDSRASHHVTSDVANVVAGEEYTGTGKLLVGNGNSLSISKVGQSSLVTSTRSLRLNDLQLVPSISKNLVSVSKLARDNKVFLEFHARRCVIRDEDTKAVLLEGREKDGLYEFNSTLFNNNVPTQCNVVHGIVDFGLWHRRLGHSSRDTLQQVCKDCNVGLSLVNDEICTACQVRKSHSLPFSASQTVYSEHFQLVYVDLWGPPHVVSNGYRYYISFVDAYSRFMWVYLLKEKSQALYAFRLFQRMALQEDGVRHRLTCPHTSQQNVVVERKHRHIINTALTLLAQASLPLKYWSYAITTAVYLINRCFPCLRSFQSHKFEYRSQACTFLGYSVQHEGYLCLAPGGRIYISRHVQFDESVFPFTGQATAVHPYPTNNLQPSAIIDVVHGINKVLNNQAVPPCSTLHHCENESSTSHTSSSYHRVNEQMNSAEIDADVASGDNVDGSARHTISPRQTDGSGDLRVPEHSTLVADSALQMSSHNNSSNMVVSSGIASCPSSSNVHYMVTRSKDGIFKPKVFSVQSVIDDEEPISIEQALLSHVWKDTVMDEYNALIGKSTWRLVSLPPGRTTIGCKWLFRMKKNIDGSVARYKARLVAKGFAQIPGQDFNDTFSLVIRPSTVKIVLSLAVMNGCKLRQVDVNNAFLNGDLREEVFMVQPPGSVVGALLYLNHTRPDIAYCVNRVAQYMHTPCTQHWVAMKHILRYLCETLDYGLVFQKTGLGLYLVAFADVDWASNVDDHHSISGFCIFLGGNLVSWGSKRQWSISRSTTEAEYRALADVLADVIWIQALLTDMGIPPSSTLVVWSDNTNAIAMSANPVMHSWSKHVELDLHFIWEKVVAR